MQNRLYHSIISIKSNVKLELTLHIRPYAFRIMIVKIFFVFIALKYITDKMVYKLILKQWTLKIIIIMINFYNGICYHFKKIDNNI